MSPSTGTPTPGPISSPFNNPQHDWLAGHRGVDLTLAPASVVRSAGSGTVAYVGVIAGVPTISIDHPDGIRTTYQPVFPRVAKGDVVAEGEQIGTLSPYSLAHGTGLHWGARTGKKSYINPLSLLEKPVIRLKPV